jgi:hypothetical protein
VAGPYETWMGGLGFGPNWMHDPVGNAYWGAVGAMIDQQVARMKLAVRCRYPADALTAGMSDALDEAGRDRLLPRGGTTPGASDESDASYAPRVQDPWTAWAQAGRPFGLLTALGDAGFPLGPYGAMIVNHLGLTYTLGGSGLVVSNQGAVCINRQNLHGTVPSPPLTGFTLDARDQFFAHFLILFQETVSGLDNTAGNPIKACLNQTVARWRTGGAIYNGAAIVPTNDKAWDWPPADEWDENDTWTDGAAVFIDPL